MYAFTSRQQCPVISNVIHQKIPQKLMSSAVLKKGFVRQTTCRRRVISTWFLRVSLKSIRLVCFKECSNVKNVKHTQYCVKTYDEIPVKPSGRDIATLSPFRVETGPFDHNWQWIPRPSLACANVELSIQEVCAPTVEAFPHHNRPCDESHLSIVDIRDFVSSNAPQFANGDESNQIDSNTPQIVSLQGH